MRRRVLLGAVAGALLAAPIGRAQQTRLPVVGYLGLTSLGAFVPLLTAFQQGLGEAGYLDGRNVALEYRWAEGRQEKLAALAADLVARNVDVITTHGGTLARARPGTPRPCECSCPCQSSSLPPDPGR